MADQVKRQVVTVNRVDKKVAANGNEYRVLEVKVDGLKWPLTMAAFENTDDVLFADLDLLQPGQRVELEYLERYQEGRKTPYRNLVAIVSKGEVAQEAPTTNGNGWKESYKYSKEGVELERASIERQLALKITAEYYDIPEAQRPSFPNFTETYKKMLALLQGTLPLESPPKPVKSPAQPREEPEATEEAAVDIPMPATVKDQATLVAAVRKSFAGLKLVGKTLGELKVSDVLGMSWTDWVVYHNEDEKLACKRAWEKIQEASNG